LAVGSFNELVTQDSLNKVEIPVTDNLEINFKTIWNLFFMGQDFPKDIDLIHLQHIWNPTSSDGLVGLSKKIPYHYASCMLEPWIMAHNPWKKKIALFYTRKSHQRRRIFMTAQMELRQHKSFGF
jgi:hypothetical protein